MIENIKQVINFKVEKGESRSQKKRGLIFLGGVGEVGSFWGNNILRIRKFLVLILRGFVKVYFKF